MNVATDAELQDWLDSLPPVKTVPTLTPKSQRQTFEQMKALALRS